PPVAGTPRWYAANYSRQEWAVGASAGRVTVGPDNTRSNNTQDGPAWIEIPFRLAPSPVGKPPKTIPGKERAPRRRMVKVEDGYLLGQNAGEWGGDIWWFSPDGTKQYKVSDHQPVQFFETKHGLLAVEGLAHMGISEGSVIRLRRTAEGRW